MTVKAITIWQPWASLIMIGAKVFEFRKWPAPRALRGERIVIHAGARAMRKQEIAELLNCPASMLYGVLGTKDPEKVSDALNLLERIWNHHIYGPQAPLGFALGVATLGEPKRCTELFPGDDNVDPNMWGWPLSDVVPWKTPMAIKGAQGFWNWPKDMDWLVTS